MHSSIRALLHTFVHSCITSYIRSLLPTFLHSFITSYIPTFVHYFLHSYFYTFVHYFLHSYIRVLLSTFLHSCITSYIPTFVYYFLHWCTRVFDRTLLLFPGVVTPLLCYIICCYALINDYKFYYSEIKLKLWTYSFYGICDAYPSIIVFRRTFICIMQRNSKRRTFCEPPSNLAHHWREIISGITMEMIKK